MADLKPTQQPPAGPSGAGAPPVPQKPSAVTGPGGPGASIPAPGKSGK